MTERNDHKFDQIIRKKLSHYDEPVPVDIWENISIQRKSSSFILSHYKLIISVLFVSVLSVAVIISANHLTKNNKQPNTATAEMSNSNGVLLKTVATYAKTISTSQPLNDETSVTENNSDLTTKPSIRSVSSVNTSSIYKQSENILVRGKDVSSSTNGGSQMIANNNLTGSKSSIVNPTSSIKTTNEPPNAVATITETANQSSANLFNNETGKADNIVDNTSGQIPNTPSDHSIPQIISTNPSEAKTVLQIESTDSSSDKQLQNVPPPIIPFKPHLKCIDLIFSPGLLSKSIKSSDPASESYVQMLDRVTKTKYSIGFDIRYRYFLNEFWNIATGLMYNEVKEQLIGQVKPEQISIKQTMGTIITPFDPPKQIILKSDTVRIAAKTVSQNNTFTYLRIPILVGANFNIFKVPLNFYAGFGVYYSIKQQGAYINTLTLETADIKNSTDNPYKNRMGVNVQTGINASIKMAKRCYFLLGADYSRFVIPINDKKYPIEQYYSIWNLNLGITYQIF